MEKWTSIEKERHKTGLIAILASSDAQRQYCTYLVRIEHKPIPKQVLNDLSFDRKMSILEEYNKARRENR